MVAVQFALGAYALSDACAAAQMSLSCDVLRPLLPLSYRGVSGSTLRNALHDLSAAHPRRARLLERLVTEPRAPCRWRLLREALAALGAGGIAPVALRVLQGVAKAAAVRDAPEEGLPAPAGRGGSRARGSAAAGSTAAGSAAADSAGAGAKHRTPPYQAS